MSREATVVATQSRAANSENGRRISCAWRISRAPCCTDRLHGYTVFPVPHIRVVKPRLVLAFLKRRQGIYESMYVALYRRTVEASFMALRP